MSDRTGDFGSGSSFERLMREERHQRRMIEELSQPIGFGIRSAVDRATREAQAQSRAISEAMGNVGTLPATLEAERQASSFLKAIDRITGSPSYTATIENFERGNLAFSEVQRRAESVSQAISKSLGSLGSTLAAEDSVRRSIMASGHWAAQMNSLTATAASFSSKLGQGIIDRQLAEMKLGAGLSTELSRRVLDEMSNAERVLEQLASSQTPEDSERFFAEFMRIVGELFAGLKFNTLEEFRKLGLLALLAIALSLKECVSPR